MIKAQYNILGFYASKDARLWDRLIKNGGNHELFRVFLETNTIPAVQLIVDSGTSATIQLLDSNDEAVGSALNMTVESETGYKRLIYTGTTLTGNTDGDYSLKITVDGTTDYYSDVFGWTSDANYLDEMIKISAVSSNIRLGKSYTANLTGFTFECYLNAEYIGIQPDFTEEVTQSYGANNVIYGNLVPTREFNIDGGEHVYRFLLGLRALEVNGTVTVTWGNVDYTANDIMAEVAEEHFEGLEYMIKLSFVDYSELVSVMNTTN